MPKVAVVKLRYVPKTYWFSPAGIACEEGDHVLVETARGKEIGLVVEDLREVEDRDIQQPLKPVLRIATEADLAQADEMNRRGEEAMGPFRELIEKHGLEMKPVRVEFMFAGDFATFYFAADDRVDFRSLVRDLASQFKIHVDMRQIGARDEARMIGGLGHCGEELCCSRMGGEFQPVSIRMAKEQDLPLNPGKISGLCGRLMCCLRYEFEAYKDFKGRAPKKNAVIDTPMGMAKVVEFDTPRERLRLRMEDGSSLVVPLSSMDTAGKEPREGERVRPCHIGQEAFDKIMEDLHHDANLAMMGDKLFSSDENLADKVATSGQINRNDGRRGKVSMGSEHVDTGGSGRSRRSRTSSGRNGAAVEPKARDQRTRRRSVAIGGPAEGSSEEEKPAKRMPRQRRAVKSVEAENDRPQGEDAKQEKKSSSSRSRRRRRGGRGSGSGSKASQSAQGSNQQEQQSQQRQQGKPRPGQKSSTLHGDAGATSGAASDSSGENKPKRRRRRRGGRGRGGRGGGNGGGSNADGGSAPQSE